MSSCYDARRDPTWSPGASSSPLSSPSNASKKARHPLLLKDICVGSIVRLPPRPPSSEPLICSETGYILPDEAYNRPAVILNVERDPSFKVVSIALVKRPDLCLLTIRVANTSSVDYIPTTIIRGLLGKTPSELELPEFDANTHETRPPTLGRQKIAVSKSHFRQGKDIQFPILCQVAEYRRCSYHSVKMLRWGSSGLQIQIG